MAQFRFNSQPRGDLLRSAIERIPTTMGRLAYIAGLRNPASNLYSHPSVFMALGADDADQALRRAHYEVFSEWLALGLEDQKSDISGYLAAEGLPPQALRGRDFVPPQAREVERQLYFTDLEMILELLDLGGRAASPEE